MIIYQENVGVLIGMAIKLVGQEWMEYEIAVIELLYSHDEIINDRMKFIFILNFWVEQPATLAYRSRYYLLFTISGIYLATW